MTTHFFDTEDTLVTCYKHLLTREIIYFSTVLFIFHTNIKRGTYFAITHDLFSACSS